MLKKGGKLKSAHNVENTQNPEKRRKYDVRQSICLGGLIMGSNHKGDSNAGYEGSQYWQENREKKKTKNETVRSGRGEMNANPYVHDIYMHINMKSPPSILRMHT